MEYHRLHRNVLEGFVKRRNLQPTSTAKRGNKPKKEDLIRALETADRDWRFRFFDLSPELRNIIYRKLLAVDFSKQSCYSNILATCKQANHEARDLIYCETVVPITFNNSAIKVHKLRVAGHWFGGETDLNNFAWPDSLRRARNIKITAGLYYSQLASSTPLDPGRLNTLLYSLGCHLSNGASKLDKFELDITGVPAATALPLPLRPIILDPLQLLGSLDTLTVITHDAKTVRRDSGWIPASNLLGGKLLLKARELIQEALAYDGIYHVTRAERLGYERGLSFDQLSSLSGFNIDGSSGPLEFSGLRAANLIKRKMICRTYCDPHWERDLIGYAREVERAMDTLNVSEIQRRATTAAAQKFVTEMMQHRSARSSIVLPSVA